MAIPQCLVGFPKISKKLQKTYSEFKPFSKNLKSPKIQKKNLRIPKYFQKKLKKLGIISNLFQIKKY